MLWLMINNTMQQLMEQHDLVETQTSGLYLMYVLKC